MHDPVDDVELASLEPSRRRSATERLRLVAATAVTVLLVAGGIAVAARDTDEAPRRSLSATGEGPAAATTSTTTTETLLVDEALAPVAPPAVEVTVPPAPVAPAVTVPRVRHPGPTVVTLPAAPPAPPTTAAPPPPGAAACAAAPAPWSVNELGVYTVPTAGGAGRRILAYPQGAGEPQDVVFSPDGRRIALTRLTGRTDGSNETSTLHLADADGTNEREVAPATAGPTHLAWAPSGGLLAFRDSGPEPGRVSTYVLDVATDEVRLLATQEAGAGFLRWSTDGRALAWAGMSGPTGVWVHDLATATTRRLDEVASRDVSWSPDGRELAVARMSGGVEVVDRSGGGRRVVHADAIRVAWSPTDRSALVTDTGGILHRADPDGAGTRFLAYAHLHGWLDTGSELVTTSVEGIHLVDLAGCRRTLVAGSGNEIGLRSWSRDGRQVLFVRYR